MERHEAHREAHQDECGGVGHVLDSLEGDRHHAGQEKNFYQVFQDDFGLAHTAQRICSSPTSGSAREDSNDS
jgi:hypothetical protein